MPTFGVTPPVVPDSLVPVLEPYERSGHVRRDAADDPGWVLPTEPGMFWWPRGADIADVLAAVPARYGSVESVLRPFSEGPTPVVRGRMPLRGSVGPAYLGGQAPVAERVAAVRGVLDRGYHDVEADNVRDTRLADALRTLEGEETGSVEVEQTPEGPRLRFQRAGVVADAAYALEIADLEEIDASFLFTLTKNLDDRITVLERRAWPRLTARLVRLKRP